VGEYFVISSTISKMSTKLAKSTHPTTELTLSLNVNHEEHVRRALADTVASGSIIFEAYTSKDLIKQDNNNKTVTKKIKLINKAA
jgi:hypothetical protein